MCELFFTFNSKQLSPSLEKDFEQRLPTAVLNSAGRQDLTAGKIRTKKAKRYEKIFDAEGIKKHLVMASNRMLRMGSIASETMVQISDFGLVPPIRSMGTIKENSGLRNVREITDFEWQRSGNKSQQKRRYNHLMPQEFPLPQTEQNFKELGLRKRGLSLKEKPLINYAEANKILPNVFRSRSINCDKKAKSTRVKQAQEKTADFYREKTPKSVKTSGRRIYYQLTRPLRSQQLIIDHDCQRVSRNSPCMNGQDWCAPLTPAFNPQG